jgi:heme/copper-type cytochrome/quinol oxidase subunit 2
MSPLQKLSIATGAALFIAVASAAYADNMGVADASGRTDWDAFGAAIWITLLVTVPAFLVFAISGIVLVVKYVHSRKTKN